MENNIDKLTKLGTEAVQSAIAQYTPWIVLQAWMLVALGIIFLMIAIIFFVKRNKWGDGDAYPMLVCVSCILTLVALLCIIFSIPDLKYPKAAAIHQLLKDASKKD